MSMSSFEQNLKDNSIAPIPGRQKIWKGGNKGYDLEICLEIFSKQESNILLVYVSANVLKNLESIAISLYGFL